MVGYGDKQTADGQKPSALHAKLIRLGLFVGVTGALLYSLLSLVQPQYQSSTTLYIEGEKSASGKSGTLVTREIKMLGSELMIRSFLDLHPPAEKGAMQRQGPLKRVLIMLGLSSDPAKDPLNNRTAAGFREYLSIGRGTDPQTIKIGMRSSNSKAAARLANQYAASYIARLEAQSTVRSTTMTSDAQAGLISNLKSKITERETKLAALRQDMRTHPFVAPIKQSLANPLTPPLTNSMANETKPDEKGKLTLEQLSQVTAQLILARADREQAELRAKLVQDMLEDNGRIESTSTVLNSGLVQTLLQRRARMEQKLANLKIDLLPSHPQMRRLNRDMAALRVQIKSETRKAVTNLENEVLLAAAREDSIKKSLAKLKEQRVSVAGDEAQIAKPAALQRPQPIAVDPRIAQLASLTSEIAGHRANLMVAKAQADTRSNKDAASARTRVKATVVSPAIASNSPVFPKKKPITLLGMLAAFILGLVSMIFGNKRKEEEPLDKQTSSRPMNKDAKNSGKQPQMGFGAKPVRS